MISYTVFSLLCLLFGFIQAQSVQNPCDASCGNTYFTKLAYGIYSKTQLSQEFNLCRSKCKVTAPTTATTNGQCKSTCLATYNNQQALNQYTPEQRLNIYNTCIGRCAPTTSDLNAKCMTCLTTYQNQLALNQGMQQQWLSLYQTCLSSNGCTASTPKTPTPKADCTTVCYNNYLQTVNIYTQAQRTAIYQSCIAQCAAQTTNPTTTTKGQTSKYTCHKTCLYTWTSQTYQGLYTQEQRLHIYNLCIKSCDQTNAGAATPSAWNQCNLRCLSTFNTKLHNGQSNAPERLLDYAGCSKKCPPNTGSTQTSTACNDVCLTAYNSQLSSNQGTQTSRITEYNTCKANCAGPSTVTLTTPKPTFPQTTKQTDTVSNKKTKEGCNARCAAQYEILKRSNSADFSLKIYTSCKSTCNNLPSTNTDTNTNTDNGASNTKKEQCISECGVQAARVGGTSAQRALVLTACINTCDVITAGTTSRDTAIPTVPQEQCEWACKDQKRRLKEEGKEAVEFIDKVFRTCNQQCLTIQLRTSGLVAEQCIAWSLKLRQSYQGEYTKAFLDRLQERAENACS